MEMCLKNVSLFSRQQIFDHVAKNLIKQGCQSSGWGICLYRGSNGLKCAGGWVISDKEYDPDFENMVIAGLCKKLNLEFDDSLMFLGKLQDLHDNDCSWKDIKGALNDFAELHELKPIDTE